MPFKMQANIGIRFYFASISCLGLQSHFKMLMMLVNQEKNV